MHKKSFYLGIFGILIFIINISNSAPKWLKKRTIHRMENRSLHKIMKEVNANSSENAVQKISGIKTLFDEMHIDSISQLLTALSNLKEEYRQTLEKLKKNNNKKISLLEAEKNKIIADLENEKNMVLKILHVSSIDEAIKKLNELQSIHLQLTEFTQKFKD